MLGVLKRMEYYKDIMMVELRHLKERKVTFEKFVKYIISGGRWFILIEPLITFYYCLNSLHDWFFFYALSLQCLFIFQQISGNKLRSFCNRLNKCFFTTLLLHENPFFFLQKIIKNEGLKRFENFEDWSISLIFLSWKLLQNVSECWLTVETKYHDD